MIHLYYLITLILTAFAAFNAPKLIALYNTYKPRFKRKPRPAIDATTYFELLSRIEELERQYKQRQINFKARVRDEVKEYLKQLQK